MLVKLSPNLERYVRKGKKQNDWKRASNTFFVLPPPFLSLFISHPHSLSLCSLYIYRTHLLSHAKNSNSHTFSLSLCLSLTHTHTPTHTHTHTLSHSQMPPSSSVSSDSTFLDFRSCLVKVEKEREKRKFLFFSEILLFERMNWLN